MQPIFIRTVLKANKKLLRDAHIPFTEYRVLGVWGILVDQDDLDDALDEMGALRVGAIQTLRLSRGRRIKECEVSFDPYKIKLRAKNAERRRRGQAPIGDTADHKEFSAKLLDVMPEALVPKPLPGTTVTVKNGSSWISNAVIAPLEEILLPRVQRSILIHTVGGECEPPRENGQFHVIVGGSRFWDLKSAWHTIPQTSNNGSRSLRLQLLEWEGDKQGLLITYNSKVVAELFGNNLYLLVHFQDMDESELVFLRWILLKCVELLLTQGEQVAQQAAAIAKGESGPQVYFEQWNKYSRRHLFGRQVSAFAVAMGRDVHIYSEFVGSDTQLSNLAGESLNIVLPASVNYQYRDEVIFDQVVCGHRVCEPLGGGVIAEDENGYPVAEIIGNTIRFLMMTNEQYPAAMWDTLATLIRMSPADREELAQAQNVRRLSKTREEVVEMLLGPVAASYRSALQTLDRNKCRAAAAEAAIEKLKREVRDAQSVIAAPDNTAAQTAELEAEFEMLMATGRVLDIRVNSGGGLDVFTDTIYCRDDRSGVLHEIGRFRIEFKPGVESSEAVRWFNLSYEIRGHGNALMQAPHVNQFGQACFAPGSETSQTLLEMLRGSELGAAICYAISFIEQVDTRDSWGSFINNWPRAAADVEKAA